MTLVVIVLLAVVVLVVGFGAALARRATQDVERDHLSGAPAAWAGQHTPEAKLHRRLADAVAALPADDLDVLEARLAIEQLATAVDAQLVTVARLPERVRSAPLAQATAAVEAVEDSVARVAANELGTGRAAEVESALARLQERVDALSQARKELDGGPPTPGAEAT